MPVPNPTSSETQNEYISRCMGEIGSEYEQSQALAICYSTWDKQNMSKSDKIVSKLNYINDFKKLNKK